MSRVARDHRKRMTLRPSSPRSKLVRSPSEAASVSKRSGSMNEAASWRSHHAPRAATGSTMKRCLSA